MKSKILLWEFKTLVKDPLLSFLMLMPLPLGIFLPQGWAALSLALKPWIDVESWYPVVQLMFLAMSPQILGIVLGFLWLDEKDGGLLSLWAVTPGGLKRFFQRRIILFYALCWVQGLIFLAVWGRWEWTLTLAALSLGILWYAPLMLALAKNKVEGLTWAKGLIFLGVGLLAGALDLGPWSYLGAFLPQFWIGWGWRTGQAAVSLAGLAGMAAFGLWIFRKGLPAQLKNQIYQ